MAGMEFTGGGNLARVIRLPPNAIMVGSRYDCILKSVKGIECQVGPVNRILAGDLNTCELLARKL